MGSEEKLRPLAGLITPTPPIRPSSAFLHLQAASKFDYDSSPTAPRQPSEGDGTERLLSPMIISDFMGPDIPLAVWSPILPVFLLLCPHVCFLSSTTLYRLRSVGR
jgi:hypothetical protein